MIVKLFMGNKLKLWLYYGNFEYVSKTELPFINVYLTIGSILLLSSNLVLQTYLCVGYMLFLSIYVTN
jgi:hypothetical protein